MTKNSHITELINFCEKYKTHKNFSNSAIYGGIETFDIKAKTKIDIEKFFLVCAFCAAEVSTPRYNYLNV